jgi:hypothetical protein
VGAYCVAKLVDMTDMVIGRLTVKARAPVPDRHMSDNAKSYAFWRCECTCGKIVVRSGKYLRNPRNVETISCGCMLSETQRVIWQDRSPSIDVRLERSLAGICRALKKTQTLHAVLAEVDWDEAGVPQFWFMRWWKNYKRQTGGASVASHLPRREAAGRSKGRVAFEGVCRRRPIDEIQP